MDTSASKPKNPVRKTLTECFEEACSRFRSTVEPSLGKDRQRLDALTTFLKGASTGLQQLEKTCQNLNDKAEEKANNAAKILTTLDQFKTLGDAFLQFAPESVSIVWCAISSLITIGGAKLQTLLLICGACNSVTTIVGDCIRWEVRMRTTDAADDAPTLDIWDTDIPDLVFNILEFLWSAQPHLDNSRLKRIGSTLKDIFTNELRQKIDALLEKYQRVVKIAQAHFEDSVLDQTKKTGTKINQVCDDLKKCATIGTDIIEAVQRKVLLDELDRQTARLQPSASHRTHFSTLRDRLAYIIRQRNGQPVARWLFKENAYHDWKHSSTSMLYLKSPRGYGKSIAMMSVHEDLQTPHYNNNPNSAPLNGDITKDAAVRHEQKPLLCSFFFKRGEQDIQLARTALEYILHQMLSSSALRKNASTLAEIVEVLNPAFFDPAAQKTGFMDTLTALCQAIRDVSIAIPNRVYLMVDALDECQDRREQNFSQLLADMVKPQPGSNKACNLKIIFSARDSIDIISELGCDKDINSLVPSADQTERLSTNILRIIEIAASKNWSDLDIYLRHEVKVVLRRRIDQSEGEAFAKLLDSELSRIVETIHQKAKGDFTLARMIIANLQQPSKKTLEQKVQQLPAAIGDIYMASIESLSPDEQDLIVTALKWVVWSVAGVTTIEISDHYREIYKSGPSEKNISDDAVKNSTSDIQPYTKEVENIINKDPYKDPEVKDIIYHLENAGRDFFRIDRHTNFVNVDISVREWIQDSTSVDSMTSGSRGFTRYRDGDGTTVFKFRLTQSFVRFGDNLSELFNERDAQMSIALNILYALNDEGFQNRYMSWDASSITAIPHFRPCFSEKNSHNKKESRFQRRFRYEIDHWQDHLRILQRWWTIDSIEDNWWSELLHQLSIFMRPENWRRWLINSSRDIESYGRNEELVYRMFEDPIYFACEQGLHMIVDLLAVPSKFSTIVCAPQPRLQPLETARIDCLEHLSFWFERGRIKVDATVYLQCSEVIDFLNSRVDPDRTVSAYPERFRLQPRLRKLLDHLDPLLKSAWLADWTLKNTHAYNPDMTDRRKFTLGPDSAHLEIYSSEYDGARSLLESHQWNRELVAGKIRDLIDNHLGFYFSITPGTLSRELPESRSGNICDRPDPRGRLPLCLAAPHPETVRHLIKHGANVNRLPPPDTWLSPSDPPIVTILLNASDSKDRRAMLESATILISEGAHLDVIASETKGTLLHLAAAARDLRFFKLLCVSGDKDWDVHARDQRLRTPMHWLYGTGKAPQGIKEVKEVLEICRILMKMKRSDGDDLVNAENEASLRPLALAVASGFLEGVQQLIELGADVHDEDDDGENCFHSLARHFGNMGENGSRIAQVLLDAKVDCALTNSRYKTPLFHAIENGAPELVQLLLPRYIELGMKNPKQNPLLIKDADGQTLLLVTARYSRVGPIEYNRIFRHLVAALAQFVDIKDFIRIPDLESRRTTVTCSLDCLNPDLLNYIMDLDNDWGRRCTNGLNLLDTICRFIGREGREEMFHKAAYRCLETMISSPLSFSFSFLETELFDYDRRSQISEMLVQKLINLCGATLRDCHGWSMRDVLLSAGPHRHHLLRHLPDKDPSPPERFAKPSRIGLSLTNPVKISDDGLECLPLENKWQSEEPMHILLADHPIPPIPGTFYFEIHVLSRPEGPTEMDTNTAAETPSTNEIAIGVRTMLDAPVEGHYGAWCTQSGTLTESNKSGWMRPSVRRTIQKYQAKVLGCGINLLEELVFFNLEKSDGKFDTGVHSITQDRYFPTVMVPSAHAGFRVNFGAEPFVFEDANNPEWDVKRTKCFKLR